MKREGRQHGMVRTYRIIPPPWNPRPDTRFAKEIDSPPTAGLFTKVSSKPTNHSKFTGKCGKSRCSGCRLHPVCKSKDKIKGSHKLNSRHVLIDYPLVAYSGEDFIDEDDDDDDDQPLDLTEFEPRVGVIHLRVDEKVEVEVKDEDEMSYCEVGFVVDEAMEGDDTWCLVEERK